MSPRLMTHGKFATNQSQLNKNSALGLAELEELGVKRSCLSPTLLSNYVLAISLLKNIAMKHAYPDNFEANSFAASMEAVKQVE